MRLVVFHVLFSCAFRRLIFSADTYFLRAFYFVFSSSLLIYRCRILSSRLINFSSLHSYFVCDAVYDAPSLHVKYGKKNITHCRRMTVVKNCPHARTSHSAGPAVRRYAVDFVALIRMDSNKNDQKQQPFFPIR